MSGCRAKGCRAEGRFAGYCYVHQDQARDESEHADADAPDAPPRKGMRVVGPDERAPAAPPLPLEEQGWDADIPPEALPAAVREICCEIQRVRGGALALSASMAMGALATIVQGKVRYRVTSTWAEEACIYWLVFTPPGAGKSTSTRPILAPLRAFEAEQERVVEQGRHFTMARRKGIEARMAQLGKTAAHGAEGKADIQLDEDGNPPWNRTIDPGGPSAAQVEMRKLARELERYPVPVVPRLTRSDINPQMLSKRLAQNQRAMNTSYASLGILSSEPAFLSNLKGRHSGGVPILETVLSAYDGESIQEDRAGENGQILESTLQRPLLSIVCQGQPDVLEELLACEPLSSRGFWSRCVIHNLRDSTPWSVDERELDPAVVARWNTLIRKLAEWRPAASVELDLTFLRPKLDALYRMAGERCKGHPEQAARARRAAVKAIRFIGLGLVCEMAMAGELPTGSLSGLSVVQCVPGGGPPCALEDQIEYLYNIFYPPVSIGVGPQTGTGHRTDPTPSPRTRLPPVVLRTMIIRGQDFGPGQKWSTRDLLRATWPRPSGADLGIALEELEEAGYIKHDPASIRLYRGVRAPKRYTTLSLGEPLREPGEEG